MKYVDTDVYFFTIKTIKLEELCTLHLTWLNLTISKYYNKNMAKNYIQQIFKCCMNNDICERKFKLLNKVVTKD